MSKKKTQQEDELQNVEEALSKSEQFIEKYQKQLLYSALAVLVVVVGIVTYSNKVVAPRNIEAADQITSAVRYFEQDSFALALNGDGANYGFADVVSEFGSSKSAKLAAYYAGICEYNLGNFQSAIDYLKKFTASSVNATPAAITLIGDCYVSLEDYSKAVTYFEKAAKEENSLTAPRALSKAGICYEELGQWAKAEKCYQTIKTKYFDSQLAMDMDKRIERCQLNK